MLNKVKIRNILKKNSKNFDKEFSEHEIININILLEQIFTTQDINKRNNDYSELKKLLENYDIFEVAITDLSNNYRIQKTNIEEAKKFEEKKMFDKNYYLTVFLLTMNFMISKFSILLLPDKYRMNKIDDSLKEKFSKILVITCISLLSIGLFSFCMTIFNFILAHPLNKLTQVKNDNNFKTITREIGRDYIIGNFGHFLFDQELYNIHYTKNLQPYHFHKKSVQQSDLSIGS